MWAIESIILFVVASGQENTGAGLVSSICMLETKIGLRGVVCRLTRYPIPQNWEFYLKWKQEKESSKKNHGPTTNHMLCLTLSSKCVIYVRQPRFIISWSFYLSMCIIRKSVITRPKNNKKNKSVTTHPKIIKNCDVLKRDYIQLSLPNDHLKLPMYSFFLSPYFDGHFLNFYLWVF